MQLQRVTKAQAERLKKLGFDWGTDRFYFNGRDGWIEIDLEQHEISNHNAIESDKYLSAPTIQHALMWLREVKVVHVAVFLARNIWYYVLSTHNSVGWFLPMDSNSSATHALAESAGLDAALDWLEQNEKEVGNV